MLALCVPQIAADVSRTARKLIDDGQPRKAIAALQSVKTDGDSGLQAQVGLLLGVAYYHADDPGKAIELLSPVVDRLPADSLARREADQVLGLAGVVVGRFAEAIPRLEATRRWAPDNLELAYALAQAYVQTQRADGARATVASIYGVAADSAAAHLLVAQLMIRLELEPQAEVELTQALAQGPEAADRQSSARPDRAVPRPVARGDRADHARARDQSGQRHGVLAARRRVRA